MAGTFAHWMVVEAALDKYRRAPISPHPYFPILLKNRRFACLGAVGPDYPYLTESFDFNAHSWADRMHYENTGRFIFEAMNLIDYDNRDSFAVCLSWLCGFAAHIVTDCVVHPVVNAIVGPYHFNQTEHRHCEMTQDTYIFKEMKKVDLTYAEYAKLFKQCSTPEDEDKLNPYLRKFWSSALRANYPQASKHFATIAPDKWHEKFLSRIKLASDCPVIFRHFGQEKVLVYKTENNLTEIELSRFINDVQLPNGLKGHYKEQVFDKAVDSVVDTWTNMFQDIENHNPSGTFEYFKNWNLDTGVDEDKRHFWREDTLDALPFEKTA